VLSEPELHVVMLALPKLIGSSMRPMNPAKVARELSKSVDEVMALQASIDAKMTAVVQNKIVGQILKIRSRMGKVTDRMGAVGLQTELLQVQQSVHGMEPHLVTVLTSEIDGTMQALNELEQGADDEARGRNRAFRGESDVEEEAGAEEARGRTGKIGQYAAAGKEEATAGELHALALGHGQSAEELAALAKKYGADTADVTTALTVSRQYGVETGEVLALAKRFDMAPGYVGEAFELASQAHVDPEVVLASVQQVEAGLGYRDLSEAFGDVHEIMHVLDYIENEVGFTPEDLANKVIPGLRDLHLELQQVQALSGIIERLIVVLPEWGDVKRAKRQKMFLAGLAELTEQVHPEDEVSINSQAVLAALERMRELEGELIGGRARAMTVKALKRQLAEAIEEVRRNPPEEEAGAEEARGGLRGLLGLSEHGRFSLIQALLTETELKVLMLLELRFLGSTNHPTKLEKIAIELKSSIQEVTNSHLSLQTRIELIVWHPGLKILDLRRQMESITDRSEEGSEEVRGGVHTIRLRQAA
jgi:hypothetical protein